MRRKRRAARPAEADAGEPAAAAAPSRASTASLAACRSSASRRRTRCTGRPRPARRSGPPRPWAESLRAEDAHFRARRAVLCGVSGAPREHDGQEGSEYSGVRRNTAECASSRVLDMGERWGRYGGDMGRCVLSSAGWETRVRIPLLGRRANQTGIPDAVRPAHLDPLPHPRRLLLLLLLLLLPLLLLDWLELQK